MNTVSNGAQPIGRGFIGPEHIPVGKDEHYLRFEQNTRDDYRALRADEVERLNANNNRCGNWSDVLVTGKFDPALIRDCEFHGLIRIGDLEECVLEYHDLRLPAGCYSSTIISCDLGDNVTLRNVEYISNYIIGDGSVLFNIDEMQVTNHAKFGNGILKDGEDSSVRIWLEVCNENGGRKILPFEGMLTSDAYLWSKFRGDEELMRKFVEITERECSSRRGFYGTVGRQCVIKNCQIIKDVRIGDGAYIKGGSKLKNLTINSSLENPTQIGEGCELVNGIIDCGCKIFYGVKAVRFVLCSNSSLKYGARLLNSVLGENSTISCCEVLNSLIYPSHEQHHNNSFLIACTVLGQSNIAAGATIGSNHNSRANDGEIVAGRGFWPGLCVSLKHNSKFASYTLLAKGTYPAELNIALPFSLVSNSEHENAIHILPAYWWMHNMYAIARNAWKYRARDARKVRRQEFEFDSLAPDTVEELFAGLALLETWAGEWSSKQRGEQGSNGHDDADRCRTLGRELLSDWGNDVSAIEAPGWTVEFSARPALIMKPKEAWQAYREMIHYFAVRTIVAHAAAHNLQGRDEIFALLDGGERMRWINLGGQLMPEKDVDELKRSIKSGQIVSWAQVHDAYAGFHEQYDLEKARYAFAALKSLHGADTSDLRSRWNTLLDETARIAKLVRDRTFQSRNKDYESHFRKLPYDNSAEMESVLGSMQDNEFLKTVDREQQRLVTQLESLKAMDAAAAAM